MTDNIKDKTIKIETPKGRPLLHWVGKKPLEYVQGYPTQLIELFDPENKKTTINIPKYSELEKNWHNLLFHGDNKEVLATLLELDFRGKVDLIYIDPPFASNKDYVRKVELRGLKDLGRIEEDSESIIQQTMYEDIWKRDEYFQFMYERLILLKELLAETGSIYVHLDYHIGHYVKLLMDEVFGENNLVNEIVWCYSQGGRPDVGYPNKHDTLYFYAKDKSSFSFYPKNIRVPYELISKKSSSSFTKIDEQGRKYKEIYGAGKKKRYRYYEDEGKIPFDWWTDIPKVTGRSAASEYSEYTDYITQKPERLLERVISASSKDNDLVLDCFVGSGTTCAVAQKLGRRWIGVDVNKGAIQLTSKRLQKIIKEQTDTKYPTFAIYKVNNYDLRILKTEAKELAIQQYGITKVKTDTFFDGLRDSGELVKIIDFNHPLTLLDLQLIVDELNKRPEEDRDVVVISLGRETKVDAWVEEWNKKQPYKDTRTKKRIRQFIVFDLKDKNFVSYEPSKAEIEIKRICKDKVRIKITSFISPTIIKRLELESGLLQKKIPDFRSMIDVVLVDTNYDGEVFKIGFSDVPERQNDLVNGEYELKISEKPTRVAVKIIDMLGEETLFTKEV